MDIPPSHLQQQAHHHQQLHLTTQPSPLRQPQQSNSQQQPQQHHPPHQQHQRFETTPQIPLHIPIPPSDPSKSARQHAEEHALVAPQELQLPTPAVPSTGEAQIVPGQDTGSEQHIPMQQMTQQQQQLMQMYVAAMQQNPMMVMPYMAAQFPLYSRMALPTDVTEEQPTYVNAKQYRRIIKRREARAKLEARRKVPQQRKSFLHKSRHDHACRRVRGPGGRFLTKAELQAYRKQLEAQDPEGATAPASLSASGKADQPPPPQFNPSEGVQASSNAPYPNTSTPGEAPPKTSAGLSMPSSAQPPAMHVGSASEASQGTALATASSSHARMHSPSPGDGHLDQASADISTPGDSAASGASGNQAKASSRSNEPVDSKHEP